jgi:hypothetical protein
MGEITREKFDEEFKKLKDRNAIRARKNQTAPQGYDRPL